MTSLRALAVAALATSACVSVGTSETRGIGDDFGEATGTSTGSVDPTSEISAANASGDTAGSTGTTSSTTTPTEGGSGGDACVENEDCTDQDGDLCTWPRCAATVCVEELAACPPTGDACIASECNPTTGDCDNSPLSDVPCDDDDPCTAEDTCQSGTCSGMTGLCVMPDHPVISEVLYDDPDADNDVWIELWAPAGTSLAGLTLEFVNGNDGGVDDTLALTGTIPDDGLLLIVDPSATDATLLARADVMDTFADLQNGPDSVRLVDGATVIDAVGYGTFVGDEVFGGEGSPAPDAGGGQSVARLVSYVDTDDNAADFTVRDAPTPGERND